MAKIKQQRLRRFKSVWLTEEEKKEGLRDNTPSWDTNCITPGTLFMKRLGARLQTLCNKHVNWSVSGADEPGEGEHKIMMKLRQRQESEEPILVYGLDADLILLTMLNAKSPAFLVREMSEMGIVQLNTFGEEDFSFFSIDVLKQTLPKEVPIESYVAAMSLLGNDFLPHSLTVKIRDDGHKLLCDSLKQFPDFVVEKDGLLTINHDVLYEILMLWSQEEEKRMTVTLKKKLQMRGHVQQSLDSRPLDWMVEKDLISKQEGQWVITSEWKHVYRNQWLMCPSNEDINIVCREYIFGLQWVLDYYTGQRPVNLQWCFSRLVPPLWCDLVKYLERNTYEEFSMPLTAPITPSEQLAMVLPLQSWHYLTEPSLRCLPLTLPQFWPEQFQFFSAGRIHMWECEPLLPVLTVDRIRSAVKQK
jgi:5'-3' exoribonuclease 1